MENSPYLDKPLLSERERRLSDALRESVRHADELCRMVNLYAGKLNLGRKVRSEDWAEKARAILAEVEKP